uniref:Uncharacterized protein n=1 Tax=Neogobius melanostomus TaxID=47308 RepID=A0A8C6WLA3_9GOBI
MSPLSRPSSARRPSTSLSCGRPRSSLSPRPLTGSRPSTAAGFYSPPGSRPGSSDSGLSAVETESSNLTHGAGKILFYGNPAQAIRARREKLRTAPTTSPLTPRELPVHVPEHTYEVEGPEEKGRCDVFAELRAWRKEHSRRLEAIRTEKLPQILAIHHSDEEDTEEADSCYGRRDSSTDEEEEQEERCEDQHSPDSLLQSPSPDMQESSKAAQRSSPDTMLLPSPPPSAESRADHRKAPGIRTCRLRLMQANTELLPDAKSTKRPLPAATVTAKRREDTQQLTETMKLSPLLLRTPRPPPMKGTDAGIKLSSGEKVSPCATSGIDRLLPQVPERTSITRPHTARAALQTHYQHLVLQSSRGSSPPD